MLVYLSTFTRVWVSHTEPSFRTFRQQCLPSVNSSCSCQAAGDVKGILEESTISFISLPESTLQDPDLTEDSGSEPQEVTSDHSEVRAQMGAHACPSFNIQT